MINILKRLLFLLFILLHLAQSIPHLYRRHQNYYLNRTPYHVNYHSPYNFPKHSLTFNSESSLLNDLDDSVAEEPVKGGAKRNSNPNSSLKTPMKILREKNNGQLSSSFQNKFDVKRTNQHGSIKQSSIQENLSPPIIYPNSESDLIIENTKSKTNTKSKPVSTTTTKTITTITTQSPELSSTSTTTTETPIVAEMVPVVIHNKSKLDVKATQSENKSLMAASISSTTEQPTTMNSINVIENLEIKEIKVDTVPFLGSEAVKPQNEIAKSVAENVNLEAVAVKANEVNKIAEVLVDKSKSVIEKISEISSAESPVAKSETNVVAESIVKIEKTSTNPISSELKPALGIDTSIAAETSNINIEKKTVSNDVGSLTVEILVKNESPTTNTEALNQHNKNTINSKSSVDIPPVLSHTEISLISETNETNSPLIS